jgi:hypothetical protein
MYLVTLINYGTMNNDTYVSTYSQLVVNLLFAWEITNMDVSTLIQSFTSKPGDYITGFYMTDNNICKYSNKYLVFVTTYMTGLSVYTCSIANGCSNIDADIPNPFPVGTLGISVYNVGYS